MQVKVTPLNQNPLNGEFEASTNVSYPQLAEGKLRVRVAFLPMNEQQHELVAKMLSVSEAKIVQVSADPLLKIEREVHPSLPPKVHMMGSPLWMDIEIGPRALSADSPVEAADSSDAAAEGESAGSGQPAATVSAATPSAGTAAPPAGKKPSSRSKKKNGKKSADQAAGASDTAGDTTEGDAADPKKDETVN